jgi:glutathione S-transferase
MPNLSPFCAKLETYLRMAEVPHSVVAADLRKAPKGKIPFVTIDSQLIGDSQLIIEELERRLGDRALDAGLGARERAVARSVRRMLDEAFYFVGMYFRWGTDDGFRVLAPEFKKVLPGPLRILLPVIRRSVKKALHKQGTGRHTPEEVASIGAADLDAVAELLGDQDFLFGARPRTVDASVFAFIEGIAGFPLDSPLKQHLLAHPNLVAYRDRVRTRWWKDLEAPRS